MAPSSPLTSPLTRPLAGIRVLDLSRVVSGPMCGRLLADLGADVVKVEPPSIDPTRRLIPKIDGMSAYFAQLNAGKRNICIDMKQREGVDLVHQLALGADVLIENFRAGVMDRFGLGADGLLVERPSLIYCSITGWGQSGPWRDRKCYAPLIHAETGIIEMAARVRKRPPEQEVHVHGDMYPGVIASNAVLAALFQRTNTGLGQHIDLAMGEVAVYSNDWAAVEMLRSDDDYGYDIWTNPVLEVGDGTKVALLGNPAPRFAEWVPALGAPELLEDPRFSSAAAVDAHLDEALAVLADLVRGYPDVTSLEAAMDPMLVGVVRSVADLADTDWAADRALVEEIAPGLRVPAAPWQSSASNVRVAGPVSKMGADNDTVLSDWLSLSDDALRELSAAGVLQREG